MLTEEQKKIVWKRAFGVLSEQFPKGLFDGLFDVAHADAAAVTDEGLEILIADVRGEIDKIEASIKQTLRDGPSRETIYESAKSAILPLVDCDGERAGQLADEIIVEAANTSESFCWWDHK